MSWIMWASGSSSMTAAQSAVYPAGSQVMRRGDKAQHWKPRKDTGLQGECVWGLQPLQESALPLQFESQGR